MLRMIKEIKNNVKIKISFFVYTLLVGVYTTMPKVYAADDPLKVINNLSDLVFSIISAIGGIILGFGVVQIGMSFKSHDPSQRANGFMTFAGGVIIALAKPILTRIMG